MKECVKQAIVHSRMSPLPIHPLMDFHSGWKSRKPQPAGRICAWQQQHFIIIFILFFFFVCVGVCPFSSSFSSFPLFYFYIYGLFAFGTTCLDRVIHTASKSEYFDSTLLLRKCQLQQCYPFVTFKPLPMKSFS